MKKIVLLTLLLIPIVSYANKNLRETNGARALRDQKKSMATPDIPGNFTVNFGFNFIYNKTKAMDTKFWGSKSVGLYYTFNINPPGTFFSINTGIGLGLEKYALEDNITLATSLNTEGKRIAVIDTLASNINGKKSKLAANYIEIPLEIRIYTNTANREKGAYFAMGASAGLLYQSFTKLKFSQDGVNSKVKNNTEFELNPFRATGFLRLGYRGFNVFYRFSITELFNSGKGPAAAPAKTFTIGLAFVGF